MGFTTVEHVHKYLADKYVETTSEDDFLGTIKEFQEQDFEQLAQLDAAAFGDSRRIFCVKEYSSHSAVLLSKIKTTK